MTDEKLENLAKRISALEYDFYVDRYTDEEFEEMRTKVADLKDVEQLQYIVEYLLEIAETA